ncbi:hypothetical protein [Desulfopila sp. IMCC35008]|uniref:hypothetical protein n=1 Tax=Desulfopila sp. IMCC35008 TaxID=2653858 RepID=UPI0013D03AAB|nr:hypothetical protein [Desulfopila sp. IMCC35008]
MTGKTELLAIRDDNDFFRLQDSHTERCTMAKASVFPIERADYVRQQLLRLQGESLPNARIVKLIITEEPFPT